MRRLLAVACGLALLSACATTQRVAADASVAAAAGQVRVQVGAVLASRCDSGPSPGTAFVVGDRLLLTAAHVVGGARDVAVVFEAGTPVLADVIGIDPVRDVALLRSRSELPAGSLAIWGGIQPGRSVALLGYPVGGGGLVIQQGAVSSITDSSGEPGDSQPMVAVDVQARTGQSGGPVIDDQGRVTGLIVLLAGGRLGRDSSRWITLAVPASTLSEVVHNWASLRPASQPCRDEVSRQASGPNVDLTDDALVREVGLTLSLLGSGIDQGHLASSWPLFSAAEQERLGGWERWSRSSPADWQRLEVITATADHDTVTAFALLRSVGAGGCRRTEVEFRLVRTSGVLLVDDQQASGAGERC